MNHSRIANRSMLRMANLRHNVAAAAVVSSLVLLHFNGTDAATTITDNGSRGATWSAVADAQLDTAQKKFGSASLLLDGTGDYVSTTDIGALPASGGWTIDCWVRFAALPAAGFLFDYAKAASGFGAQLYLVGGAGGKLTLSLSSNGTGFDIVSGVGTKNDFATGTDYHIALVRDDAAGAYYLYVDGVLDKTVSSAAQISNTINRLDIGAQGLFTQNYMSGWVDEFHIASGCSYPGGTTFTPPAAEYTV